MKTEAVEKWKKALGYLQKAKQAHENNDRDDLQKNAGSAVFYGLQTIKALNDVAGNETMIASGACLEFLEDINKKHYTPKELIEKARKTLKHIADILPPECKLPEP